MDISILNGTDGQKALFREALRNIRLPLESRWERDVHVTFVADPGDPGGTEYGYCTNTFGKSELEFANTWGKGGGETELFDKEVVAHEFGHVMVGQIYDYDPLKIDEISELLGGDILEDDDSWEHDFGEVFAETFKEAFVPFSEREYGIRTAYHLPYWKYPAFRDLVRKANTRYLFAYPAIGTGLGDNGEGINDGYVRVIEVPEYDLDLLRMDTDASPQAPDGQTGYPAYIGFEGGGNQGGAGGDPSIRYRAGGQLSGMMSYGGNNIWTPCWTRTRETQMVHPELSVHTRDTVTEVPSARVARDRNGYVVTPLFVRVGTIFQWELLIPAMYPSGVEATDSALETHKDDFAAAYPDWDYYGFPTADDDADIPWQAFYREEDRWSGWHFTAIGEGAYNAEPHSEIEVHLGTVDEPDLYGTFVGGYYLDRPDTSDPLQMYATGDCEDYPLPLTEDVLLSGEYEVTGPDARISKPEEWSTMCIEIYIRSNNTPSHRYPNLIGAYQAPSDLYSQQSYRNFEYPPYRHPMLLHQREYRSAHDDAIEVPTSEVNPDGANGGIRARHRPISGHEPYQAEASTVPISTRIISP